MGECPSLLCKLKGRVLSDEVEHGGGKIET